jgi:hypothetical protein
MAEAALLSERKETMISAENIATANKLAMRVLLGAFI